MRFICDAMLGRLAKRLRILGLDTIYARSVDDLAKYRLEGETAYFITKRKIKQTLFPNAVHVNSDGVAEQLMEIRRVILPYMSEQALMKRCAECNDLLVDMNKGDVERLVPEFVFHKYTTFKACSSCKRVYWEGSHVERMKEWIAAVNSP
jgi:uncharacterized protein